MKPWQKIALGVLTVGVTATATYFVVKAIKKKLADKKKAEDGSKPVPKIDLKKDIPARKVQLISAIQNQLKTSKMDAFKGVTDASFQKLSEAELDQLLRYIKKLDALGQTAAGEEAFKKSDPKGFANLMLLVNKVLN